MTKTSLINHGIEALEVIDFLKSTSSLNDATQTQLASLAKEIEMGYRKRDYILTIKPHLYLIRKGAIQIEDDNERLFEIFEKENGLAIMLN